MFSSYPAPLVSSQAPLVIQVEDGVRIDQDIILDKLISFLSLMPESKKTLELQGALKPGHCCGFSICHGAMDEIGKINWWEAALFAVASWEKGDRAALNRRVILPDANLAWPIPLLKTIFDRVLHYIVYHQAHTSLRVSIGEIQNLNQDALLDASKNFFEVVTKTKEGKSVINKLTHSTRVGGNFTAKTLARLLVKTAFSSGIGLISNWKHGVRIGYNMKEQHWRIYDSDYDSARKGKIYRIFSTQEQAAQEVMRILGSTLKIQQAKWLPPDEVAEFKRIDTADEIFREFENIIDSDPITLLQETGFSMIAISTPKHLPRILDKVHELKGGERAADFSAWRGWQCVTGYAYVGLLTLFCGSYQVEPEWNGNDIIAEAFGMLNPFGSRGLHLLTEYAPKSLGKCLDYVHEAKDGAETIASAAAIISEGMMGLHAVIIRAPSQFPALIRYVKEAPRGSEIIKLALEMKVSLQKRADENSPLEKAKMTGYEMIKHQMPQHLHLVQEFMDQPALAAAPVARMR